MFMHPQKSPSRRIRGHGYCHGYGHAVLVAGALMMGGAQLVQAQTDYCGAGDWRNINGSGYSVGNWYADGWTGNYACTRIGDTPRSFTVFYDVPANNFLNHVGLMSFANTQTVDSGAPWVYAYHEHSLYNASGSGSVHTGLYGWLWQSDSVNREWYIIEDWYGTKPAPGGSWKGTIVDDGGTYDIYFVAKYANGSWPIWDQVWSIRQGQRSKGTIYYNQHFKKWRQLGMPNLPITRVTFALEPGSAAKGQVAYNWITINAP